MMKLTQKALNAINTPPIRRELTNALEVTDQTIVRYIKDNDDCLTKAAAMQIIRKHTGLSDKEILEEQLTETSR
jgi:hypothetical protein